MTETIRLPDLRASYHGLVERVADGDRVAPRGLPTRELRNVTLLFPEPVDMLPVGVGRGVSVNLNAFQAACVVAGIHDPAMMIRIAPAAARFDADGVDRERYGPRTVDQVTGVLNHLVEDQETREAIITLQPPHQVIWHGGRDFPCTTSIQFMIRGGRLCMTVSMRSNDVWHGLSGDAFVFSQLQHTLAGALGVGVGDYAHFAASLHLYESELPKVLGLHQPLPESRGVTVRGFVPPDGGHPLARLTRSRVMALSALGKADYPIAGYDHRWYAHRLEPFW